MKLQEEQEDKIKIVSIETIFLCIKNYDKIIT